MKINAGQTAYGLPEDFDRPLDVALRLVDNVELAALHKRNPDMVGCPIFGCIVKGFDNAPTSRLYVWPKPAHAEDIEFTYWPVCVAKSI